MPNRSYSLFENAIKSPQTKEVYRLSLHEFMRFANIKEYDDITKLKTDDVQKLLEDWVLYLKERNLKAATIRTKLNAVELFLDMNKMMFHKKSLHKLIPSDDYISGGQKPFLTEEIGRMLSATTKLRAKALIHYLASTGARPSSIADPVLSMKHVQNMPLGCKAIKIYDGSKEGYYAFLTPEASTALDDYLRSRKLNGEEIGPESPVFSNTDSAIHTKKKDFLSAKSIRQILYKIMEQAGIERVKSGNRYDKAAVYGFRKRFNTILKLNNDVNSNIAEKLMAHKLGLDGTYLQPTIEECFKEFQKAIEQLTIDSTQRQKQQIKSLEQEKSELEKLKNDVRNNQETINSFKELLEDIMSGKTIPSIYHPDQVIREGKSTLVSKEFFRFSGNPFATNCEKCKKRDSNRSAREKIYYLEIPALRKLKKQTPKQKSDLIAKIRESVSDQRHKNEFANLSDDEIIPKFLKLMDSYSPHIVSNMYVEDT